VFSCAQVYADESTMHAALAQVEAGARRELPELNLSGLAAEQLVQAVRTELKKRGVLI
jgi:hypothetical protein